MKVRKEEREGGRKGGREGGKGAYKEEILGKCIVISQECEYSDSARTEFM
jgi:hypothetical protein